MKNNYDNLKDLIKDNLSLKETEEAQNLIKELKNVKARGFLTKKQFYDVAMWKTPRPKNYYLSNSEKFVKKISKNSLSSKTEEEKIITLTSLKGVSIPVASSLLTIINPKKYVIIDIRVWKLLYSYGEIRTKPGGQGFNLNDWKNYISILRKYSGVFDVNVRDIERTLFFYHRKNHEGKLYT